MRDFHICPLSFCILCVFNKITVLLLSLKKKNQKRKEADQSGIVGLELYGKEIRASGEGKGWASLQWRFCSSREENTLIVFCRGH